MRDDFRGILRRRGESGVFETIDTRLQSATNLFRTMRVSDDRKFSFVRFVDDRLHFLHRHLILIDQLDHVDSRFGQRAHLGTRIFDALHAPTHIISSWIRLVLNEWARM